MKIVITGSLGHISKPLAQLLIKKNHTVTVISSNAERQKEIEAMGAEAAIGFMEDTDFLTKVFTAADIVYCMESLGHGFFFKQDLDYMTVLSNIGNSYKQAIQRSGVKKVIHLSSIGAHTGKGVGMLAFHYNVEKILAQLPHDVIIKTMRPVGFYYNMLAYIPTIKAAGTIIQNYGGDEKEPWVSPFDIATVIAEEMELPFDKRMIRYIASDELSPNEVAKILGQAIGNNELQWQTITDEQMLNRMIANGMNPNIAEGLVKMNAGRRSGVLYEDYYRNRPALSNTKLKDYSKEFATIFNQQK
ncbi:MAG: NmrA family NAD(P)-binding protein [Ferruginibacter sp.]